MNSLHAWLNVLENRHSVEIQLDLERILNVAKQAQLLKFDAFVITVGGTNGKGSTVALLESLYIKAGYDVASYTSPHIYRFNERIKINTIPISDEDLVNAFEQIHQIEGSHYLTYFEMTTLAALWHFKKMPLDIIILEVGLGGRLDATNIIDANLSIITTVDMDHEQYLGHTKEAIGYEKAGIIRSKKPVIYADTDPPQSVLNAIKRLQAISFIKGEHYAWRVEDDTVRLSLTPHGQEIFYKNNPANAAQSLLDNNETIEYPLSRFHENSVAASVIAALYLHPLYPVDINIIHHAISHCSLEGRFQKFARPHLTLLDVAHNPQAANHLAQHIKTYYPDKRLFCIFSALSDKDVRGITFPLKTMNCKWFVSPLRHRRGADIAQLSIAFSEKDTVLWYNTPLESYIAACNEADTDVLMVVYGSFFMVEAIGRHLRGLCGIDNQ